MNLPYTTIPRTIWHGGRIASPGDDSAEVAELQSALVKLGIDPGPIDGLVGWRTRLAHALAWVRYGQQRVGWWEHDSGVRYALRHPDWLADQLDAHGCDYVVLEVAKWDDAKAFQAVATPGEIGQLMRHLRKRGIEPHVMLWPIARTQFVGDMGRWLRELCDYERPESIQWDCEGTYFATRTDGGEAELMRLSRMLGPTIGATTYPFGVRKLRDVLSVCDYLAGQYYEQVDDKRGWNHPPGSLMPGDFGEPDHLDLWCGRAAYRQPTPADAAESFVIAVEAGYPRICYWSGWWCRREDSDVGKMLRRLA